VKHAARSIVVGIVLATMVLVSACSLLSSSQKAVLSGSDTAATSEPTTEASSATAVPTSTEVPATVTATATPVPATPSPTIVPSASPTATNVSPTVEASTPAPTLTATVTVAQTAVPLPSQPVYHVVQWGDNLTCIALRYGTSVSAIAQANGIVNVHYVRVGQTLLIPVSGAVPASGVTPTSYVVQMGDTLTSVAGRFGTTVWAIAQANGIWNVDYIRIGQVLLIPAGGMTGSVSSLPRMYIVRSGDTLITIAWRFGITQWAIIQANGIVNPNLIYIGQRLYVP